MAAEAAVCSSVCATPDFFSMGRGRMCEHMSVRQHGSLQLCATFVLCISACDLVDVSGRVSGGLTCPGLLC